MRIDHPQVKAYLFQMGKHIAAHYQARARINQMIRSLFPKALCDSFKFATLGDKATANGKALSPKAPDYGRRVSAISYVLTSRRGWGLRAMG